MKKWLIWSIILILIVGIVSLIVWGILTNWGKSFNAEEASRYCYTACLNQDRENYCTPNLIVKSEEWGGKAENINCKNLIISGIISLSPCQDINCP